MQTIVQHNPFGGATTTAHAGSRPMRWTGRVMSGLAVAFLIFDSLGKLLEVQPVIDGTKQLGYSPDLVFGLGVTLISCVVAYLVPWTSVLGAVLLTGYLGGAVATHVRVGSPLVTHVLFPTYIAALLWGGLMLRDARLRAILTWHDRSRS
jgi:DoxX-like protein